MSSRSNRVVATFLALVACVWGGCALRLEPQQAGRVASDRYNVRIAELRGTGFPSGADDTGIFLDLAVVHWPRDAVVRSVRVSDTEDSSPCEGAPVAPAFYLVRGSSRRASGGLAPNSGDTLRVALSRATWNPILQGPARVDVEVEEADGTRHCVLLAAGEKAAVPFVPRDRWTLSVGVAVDDFSRAVSGVQSVAYGTAELGRSHGPVRWVLAGSVGSAQCQEQTCEPPGARKVRNGLYLQLSSGADLRLAELRIVALDLGVRYRAGFTAVNARAGERSVVLHGPALAPGVGLSLAALPLPWGVDGLHSGGILAVQAPLGWTFGPHAGRAFSVGFATTFVLPLP